MNRIRKSKFVHMMCLFMSFSFFLISCDPNNDLANDYKIDKAIDEQMALIETQYSNEECERAKKTLAQVKAYVLGRSQVSLVSRAEVLNFLIDKSIESGEIEGITQEERDLLVSTFEQTAFHLNESSLDPVYGKMKLDETISEGEMEFLVHLEDMLMEASDNNEVLEIFAQVTMELEGQQARSSQFKIALVQGFDQAELAMCASLLEDETQLSNPSTGFDLGVDGNQASERCEILQCVTEYTWVIKIITVVIAVVAILLAIFTFGFSLLLVSITFAAWVLVPIIVCAFIPCPPEDCPSGQSLTCMDGFALNADNLCFASGFKFLGDAIYSDPTNGTDCPPGAVYTGSLTGCFHGIVGGIFGDLVDGQDYWADADGAYHTPVCN